MVSLAEENRAEGGSGLKMLVKAVPMTLPGGEIKYQCPRCWGVYSTQEQAENIDSNSNNSTKQRTHRCRAGPWRK